MRFFKDKLSLIKNKRGCYILDTIKGCSICGTEKPDGCYDDCYAKRIAKRYGVYFDSIIKRKFDTENEQLTMFDFVNNQHENKIIKQIKNNEMPFVRIGEMGDPSENWEHTIDICKKIAQSGKTIVIITKHLKKLPEYLLGELGRYDICVNTSISALDTNFEIETRLLEYKRFKRYCKSVLRVVTCDFNKENEEGNKRHLKQEELLTNTNVIDTIFRPSLSNRLIKENIINIKRTKFLKGNVIASVYNDNTYFGDCYNCNEKCGIHKL